MKPGKTGKKTLVVCATGHAFALCCAVLAICGGWLHARAPDSSALGLPPAVARHSPEQVALGRKLFFDTRLSADGSVSCASCHVPEKAFADGLAVSKGVAGQHGTRNAPSLVNAAFNRSQFWDGRTATLEAQALEPLTHPREHGLADLDAVLKHLRGDTDYVQRFRQAFGIAAAQIQPEYAAQAMAAFERTLLAADTPFDRYRYGGDTQALSAPARRGLALFTGTARCASCHTIETRHAVFTDEGFHRLSVGFARIERELPRLTTRLVQARASGEALDRLLLAEPALAELGRFAVTLQPEDIARFRTPSLRNVAVTAPYMHDGSVATLEEAVDLEVYYRSTEGAPLILTPAEKADLVTFLHALTSPHLGRLAAASRE
jgi:cytochrome c peroxidase